jgi:hypothetical protein
LLKTYRTSMIYHTSMSCWPLTFILTPFLNFIIRTGYDDDSRLVDPRIKVILWIGIALVLMCSRLAALAFTSASFHFLVSSVRSKYHTRTNIILIRDHSPSPSYLGACSGLVQVAMCVSRMFSPAFIRSVLIARIAQ